MYVYVIAIGAAKDEFKTDTHTHTQLNFLAIVYRIHFCSTFVCIESHTFVLGVFDLFPFNMFHSNTIKNTNGIWFPGLTFTLNKSICTLVLILFTDWKCCGLNFICFSLSRYVHNWVALALLSPLPDCQSVQKIVNNLTVIPFKSSITKQTSEQNTVRSCNCRIGCMSENILLQCIWLYNT